MARLHKYSWWLYLLSSCPPPNCSIVLFSSSHLIANNILLRQSVGWLLPNMNVSSMGERTEDFTWLLISILGSTKTSYTNYKQIIYIYPGHPRFVDILKEYIVFPVLGRITLTLGIHCPWWASYQYGAVPISSLLLSFSRDQLFSPPAVDGAGWQTSKHAVFRCPPWKRMWDFGTTVHYQGSKQLKI